MSLPDLSRLPAFGSSALASDSITGVVTTSQQNGRWTFSQISSAIGSVATLGFFNVKDYGAVGDGSHDDTSAINSAVAAMYGTSTHGGTVYFPPGAYKVTSQINLAGASPRTGRIAGAGCSASIIQGNITNDFVVRLDDTVNGVQEICDLSITNQSTNIGSGALVYVQPAGVLRNLKLTGQIGLWSGWNEFVSTIIGIEAEANSVFGSIGLVLSGSTLIGCHLPSGLETGITITGVANNISSVHIENVIIGMRLGWFVGVATSCTMTSAGTTGVLTVGGTIYPNITSSIVPIQIGDQIVATGIASTITVTVASLGTGTGGTGTYNVTSTGGNVPALSSAQAITFRRKSGAGASSFANYETEAVGTAIRVDGCDGCVIGPCDLTGTLNQAPTLSGINSGSPQCGISISQAEATVFQNIVAAINCSQAAIQFDSSAAFYKYVIFSGCTGVATLAAVTDATATIDNGSHSGAGNVLTVNGLTNPIGIGGVVSGTGVPTGSSAPLIDSEVGFPSGSYSGGGPNKQYVLKTRAGGAISLNLSARVFTITHGSAWGLDNQTTLPGMNGNLKSSINFVNCNNPALGMVFANLPGQSGVQTAGPVEGQMYDITDGSTATFGATVAGAGGNHVRARYNGTNWTVMGA